MTKTGTAKIVHTDGAGRQSTIEANMSPAAALQLAAQYRARRPEGSSDDYRVRVA